MKMLYSYRTLLVNLSDDCDIDQHLELHEENKHRDNQLCEPLNENAIYNRDETVLVKWQDGEVSEVSILALGYRL